MLPLTIAGVAGSTVLKINEELRDYSPDICAVRISYKPLKQK